MFNAILWDMDGTIVDTERVVWTVMQSAFKHAVQIDLPEALFESLLGQSELDFYRAMGAELMDGWTVCRVSGAALRALAERGA